jgi:hypothetical protein
MPFFGWLAVQNADDRTPGLDDANTPAEIRSAILGYLRTHRNWYHRWSAFYSLGWNVLTLLVLVLGALTSILQAVGGVDQRILVILPALSSLCAALLIQFRLKDVCRIREQGRIAIELLICRALELSGKNADLVRREAIELREAAHQVELDQLIQFLSDDSIRRRGAASPVPSPGQPDPAEAPDEDGAAEAARR